MRSETDAIAALVVPVAFTVRFYAVWPLETARLPSIVTRPVALSPEFPALIPETPLLPALALRFEYIFKPPHFTAEQ